MVFSTIVLPRFNYFLNFSASLSESVRIYVLRKYRKSVLPTGRLEFWYGFQQICLLWKQRRAHVLCWHRHLLRSEHLILDRTSPPPVHVISHCIHAAVVFHLSFTTMGHNFRRFEEWKLKSPPLKKKKKIVYAPNTAPFVVIDVLYLVPVLKGNYDLGRADGLKTGHFGFRV